MKTFLSVIFLVSLLNTNTTYAQNVREIDSLKRIVKNQTSINKYDPLISLVRALAPHDYNKALEVAEKAYELAIKHSDSAKMVQAGRICGQLFNYLDRSNEAIAILSKVKDIALRNNLRDDYKTILSNIAISHTFRAEYDKALNLHFEVLALHEDDMDSLNISLALSNIGLVYYKIKNFNQALTYNFKAFNLRIALKDQHNIEILLMNIGLCYNHLNQFESARQYFRQAFEKCNTNCNTDILLHGHQGLGVSYLKLQDYSEARSHLEQSLQTARSINNKRFIAENLFWLAKVNIQQKNFSQASKQLFEVEDISKSETYKELLSSAYEQLSVVFDEQKDYYNSSLYLKKYVAVKDSIYNEKVMDNLAQAKADYEQRENLATIKANEMTIAQQKRLTLSVILITILAVLLAVVLMYAYRASRKLNAKLTKAQDIIFDQNKQLSIRNRELDKLVEKKTEELQIVNRSLKQVNNELDAFIHRTAHDIRSPLATLKGICNVALMDSKDEVSRVYLHKTSNTTERLNSILKRLLALNKINNSKVTFSTINLNELIDNIISVQIKKGLPKNLLIQKNIKDSISIESDQDLLSILIENAIDNAVKYCNNSPRAAHFIQIDIELTRNGRTRFCITNNGISAPDYISKNLDQMLLESGINIDHAETGDPDLYFVKTAARKIGGKVDLRRTIEGYNELSVVL